MNTLNLNPAFVRDDPARTAPPYEAPWERQPEPGPVDISDQLAVLANDYQFTNAGRTAAQLATILIDNDFLAEMPFPALLEILRHSAKGASVEWQHTRSHLINILEDIEAES